MALAAFFFIGCSSKGAIPCDSDATCAPYGAFCIDKVCMLPVDMASSPSRDATAPTDLPGPVVDPSGMDLAGADLSLSCHSGQSCPAAAPICGVGDTCRTCVASDHQACVAADVLQPRCDESTGLCAACRPAAALTDCPDSAFSACGSDGSCRQVCTRHGDCASGMCDMQVVDPTQKTCVRAEEIVYVSASASCVSHAGTMSDPVCDVDAALVLRPNGGFIRVLSSATTLSPVQASISQSYEVVGTGTFYGLTSTNPPQLPPIPIFTVVGNGRLYLEGLTLRGGSHGITCTGNVGGAASLTLQTSVVQGAALEEISVFACAVSMDRTLVSSSGGDGFHQSSGSLVRMTNSAFVRNTGTGVNIGSGVTVDPTHISNLTLRQNSTAAFNCGPAMTVYNSIAWGNQAAGSSAFSGACTFLNSSIDPAVPGTTNNNIAPVFKTTTIPQAKFIDFHLASGTNACCVDKAVSVDGVTLDYDGQQRPNGSAPDIGADEVYP